MKLNPPLCSFADRSSHSQDFVWNAKRYKAIVLHTTYLPFMKHILVPSHYEVESLCRILCGRRGCRIRLSGMEGRWLWQAGEQVSSASQA